MSAFVSAALLVPRYALVTGLTLLAIAGSFPEEESSSGSSDDDAVDFEAVLPFAMREYMPIGLRGLLVAALLSAFMSTFAATVNAAPAYLVNDVYKKYVSPGASERRCVRLSYVVSTLVVCVGVGVGFHVDSLNDILQWIVGALYGGYTAPNLLKFHWWRFNASGYFWGMIAGIVAALVVPRIAPFKDLATLYSFPPIFVASLLASVTASLVTVPDPPEVLDSFYLRVRPWGFWGPVADRVCGEDTKQQRAASAPDGRVTHVASVTLRSRVDDVLSDGSTAFDAEGGQNGQQGQRITLGDARTGSGRPIRNGDFCRDAFNVVVGTVWQTALTLLGCCIVLRLWRWVAACAGTVMIAMSMLKFTWYDRLVDYPPGAERPGNDADA